MFPDGRMLTLTSVTTSGDDYGDSTETDTSRKWGPCMVYPRYAVESADPRVAPVRAGVTIIGPAVAIDSDDRITDTDGTVWMVDGEPSEWVKPYAGWPGVVEVAAKRAQAV